MNNAKDTKPGYPQAILKKDDRAVMRLIWIISIAMFLLIASLEQVHLKINLGFNPHIFALLSMIINSMVALILCVALWAALTGKYYLHGKLMLAGIILSVLFLLFYILHHVFTGDTRYGDINHDGILSADEKLLAGNSRYFYYALLITHIPLAAIVMPFVLFAAYRGLSGDYKKHKKLVRWAWPIWFYVSVSGVAVYLMIRKYY
ncbi:MAG: DUF420 domain-containing protein [Chitinophagaceae bacterium]|nr:DUF420 domain-containing protein [Chitinophagaceae bacterium]